MLRLAEKPGKPDPPAITSANKSTVSLSWKPPSADGGAEITNYVVEHREEGLAKWTRATKDTISKTSYTVTGLTANSTYEFRLAAENKAGVGPPSEPSQPVAAKETVCKCLMGCLHDPSNVQQFTCILNAFAGSLLDVCWIV